MPMKRSGLISILFLPALASCVMSGSRPETTEYAVADRPNVVIILADDLGSADLSIYGSSFRTPEIDALAREGAAARHARLS